MNDAKTNNPAATARRLIVAAERASLATLGAPERQEGLPPPPFVSLVLMASTAEAVPILLMSSLAEHTRNLDRDDRAALLIDGTAGLDDPLTGPRLTLSGRVIPDDDDALRSLYLLRHPSATLYADFTDFRFFHFEIARAQLIAGFGRIHRFTAAELADPLV